MAQPTITATLDKYVYEAGDTMTLTVEYGGAVQQMMGMVTLSLDTSDLGPVAPPKVGRSVGYGLRREGDAF